MQEFFKEKGAISDIFLVLENRQKKRTSTQKGEGSVMTMKLLRRVYDDFADVLAV